jgi:S1-C subfamily serine protease
VEYGFLGVQPGNMRPELVGLARHGVIVQDIVEGTPAALVGIERSDIITHVAGKPIYDFDGLVLHVGSHAAGDRVELTVQRGTRQLPVQVTLAKYRVPGKKIVTQPEPAWRGLRVDYWTSAVDLRLDREVLRQLDLEGCVVITDVEEGSPTAAVGLKPGMAITHVADARVSTPQEFRLAVAQVADEDATGGVVPLRLAMPLAEGQMQVEVLP